MRTPRLTFVSDGNPRRRLLVRSKKGAVVICVRVCHTASLVSNDETTPRWQSLERPTSALSPQPSALSLPFEMRILNHSEDIAERIENGGDSDALTHFLNRRARNGPKRKHAL
jgi:hypothetical protein